MKIPAKSALETNIRNDSLNIKNAEKKIAEKENDNIIYAQSRITSEMSERQIAYRYSHLGLQLAITFCVFIIGGYYLDKNIGSSPWGIISGAFLGFAIGLYQLIKGANELSVQLDKCEKEKRSKNRKQLD